MNDTEHGTGQSAGASSHSCFLIWQTLNGPRLYPYYGIWYGQDKYEYDVLYHFNNDLAKLAVMTLKDEVLRKILLYTRSFQSAMCVARIHPLVYLDFLRIMRSTGCKTHSTYPDFDVSARMNDLFGPYDHLCVGCLPMYEPRDVTARMAITQHGDYSIYSARFFLRNYERGVLSQKGVQEKQYRFYTTWKLMQKHILVHKERQLDDNNDAHEDVTIPVRGPRNEFVLFPHEHQILMQFLQGFQRISKIGFPYIFCPCARTQRYVVDW